MAAPPLIPLLPQAPSRDQGQALFNQYADPFIAAMPPMVVNVNASLTWIGQQVTAIQGYATAASASADAAAQSAAIALSAQTDMSDQVEQAATYANNAAASAAAAESAPGSIGNLAAIYAAIEARG